MRERVGSSSSSSTSHSDYDSSDSSMDEYEDDEDDDEGDEEELNARRSPYWQKYRCLMDSRGYRLDTCRDVKQFYEEYWESRWPGLLAEGECAGYDYACREIDENALCKDVGLPDCLFRGTRIIDGKRVVAKAVGLHSREFDVTRLLSTAPLRDNPMNHTIPILDILEIADDDLAIIIQEEWSTPIITCAPLTLGCLIYGLRQCIEGLAFMHAHDIAHLDISLRNVLTDLYGRYAYIDFELSRRFDRKCVPRLSGVRGCAIPPDVERGADSDPYKMDIWALGTLILKICGLAGYEVPELMQLTEPMLRECSDDRPSAEDVLKMFEHVVASIPEGRLTTPSTLF